MSNEELFSFIKNFNNSNAIPLSTITQGMNILSKKDNINIDPNIKEKIYANKTSKRNSNINERSWSSNGSMSESNELFRNRGTTEGNVKVFTRESNSNKFTSDVQNKGNNKSTKIKIISQNRSTSVNAFSTSLTEFNTHKIISNYSAKIVSVANFSINNSMLPPKNFVYIC